MHEYAKHQCSALQLLYDASVRCFAATTQLFAYTRLIMYTQPEWDFLGHILDKDGLQANRKIAAVADWPVPQDIAHTWSFLGMTL